MNSRTFDHDSRRMIGNGYEGTSSFDIGRPEFHRNPVREIRSEIDPLVVPPEMARPSELLAFGPEASLQSRLFSGPLKFAIRRHRATRLHSDFRFEAFGVLLSWASYDKPSLNPLKPIRLREMGDHDLRYLRSERRIPDGSYGAGPMIVWDEGIYRPLHTSDLSDEELVVDGLRRGCLDIWLEGTRTTGGFRFSRGEQGWLFQKLEDQHVDLRSKQEEDVSIISGRTLEHIEREYQMALRKRQGS